MLKSRRCRHPNIRHLAARLASTYPTQYREPNSNRQNRRSLNSMSCPDSCKASWRINIVTPNWFAPDIFSAILASNVAASAATAALLIETTIDSRSSCDIYLVILSVPPSARSSRNQAFPITVQILLFRLNPTLRHYKVDSDSAKRKPGIFRQMPRSLSAPYFRI